jgi:di/tricarboxylate transporter
MASEKQKKRTYARNRSKSSDFFSRKGNERIYERESAFFFKLVIFILLSALWLRLENPISIGPLSVQAFPLGLIVALLLVVKLEKYQFNRKIWYATLILMAILTSFTPVGIMV